MSEHIVRNKKNVIDVKKSIHAFAMALGRQAQKEAEVRDNKEYKKAVRALFREYPGATLPMPALVGLICRKMCATPESFSKLSRELTDHIRMNNGIYLNVVRGFSGGVTLIQKGKKS